MTENERVREVRKSQNLTLEKFGEKLGLKKSTLSNIENNRTNITDQLRRSICREFHVSEEWLRTGEGEMSASSSRDDEIADFVNHIQMEDGFRKRFIAVLSRLDENGWKVLEQMALELYEGQQQPSPLPAPKPWEEMTREELEEEYKKMISDPAFRAAHTASRTTGGMGGNRESA